MDGLQGAGVAVIMRYTLRLLTLDQLARASGLSMRAGTRTRRRCLVATARGPFEIGLWVGRAATPNIMGRKGDNRSDTARSKTRQFKSATPTASRCRSRWRAAPGAEHRFEPASFTLLPDDDQAERAEDRVRRTSTATSVATGPLPILAVDEPIYRRLPAFLIATVDKFASLPFTGRDRRSPRWGAADLTSSGFYGAARAEEGQAARSSHWRAPNW